MPYVSDKQRRYFHWAVGQGKIAPGVVHEFDEASKGKKLPEAAPKHEKNAFEFAPRNYLIGFYKSAMPEIVITSGQAAEKSESSAVLLSDLYKKAERFEHFSTKSWGTLWTNEKSAGADGAVATVAVIKDGKMLWGKRRDNGKWTNPGGHLEPGEKALDGAHREVLEEAGIEIKNVKKIRRREVVTKKGKRLCIHAFIAEPVDDARPSMKLDPDQEVSRWYWIDISKGLPKEQLDNLHSPDNVLLQAMGLQTMEKEAKVIKRKMLDKFQHLKTHIINGFMKQAHWAEHAAEIGGLGVLAAPSIQKLRGKPMTEHGEHKTELAGLGILAAPSALHLAKGLIKKKV